MRSTLIGLALCLLMAGHPGWSAGGFPAPSESRAATAGDDLKNFDPLKPATDRPVLPAVRGGEYPDRLSVGPTGVGQAHCRLVLIVWAAAMALVCAASLRLLLRRYGDGGGGASTGECLSLAAVTVTGLFVRASLRPMLSDVWFEESLSIQPCGDLWDVRNVVRVSHLHMLFLVFLRHVAAVIAEPLWAVVQSASVVAGTLAIPLTWALAGQLRRPPAVRLLAAAAIAFQPVHARFSHSNTISIMVTLFLILGMVHLLYAARTGSRLQYLAGFVSLVAAADLRPEGVAYACAAAAFCAPPLLGAAHRDHFRQGLALLGATLLAAPALVRDLAIFRFADFFAAPIYPSRLLGEIPGALVESPFLGIGVTVLLFWRLAGASLAGSVRILPALAILLAATLLLLSEFPLSLAGHATNLRYYLPLTAFLCLPLAEGAHLLGGKARSHVRLPGWLMAGGLLLAAHGASWGLLFQQWAVQNEALFLLGAIDKVAAESGPNCTFVSLSPHRDGPHAFRPDHVVLQMAGVSGEWQTRRNSFSEKPFRDPGCVWYYHGGQCETLGQWADDTKDSGFPDICPTLESTARLVPLATGQVGGDPIVSESYRRNPFPVGLYRVVDLEVRD